MKVSLGTIVDEFKKRSIRKRRMMSLVTALSMLVSSGVVWELRSVGITMVNDVGCGIEEHVHGESCYAHSFLCGLEETDDSDGTGHVHSADCFSKELTCEYEEHVHSIECYDNEEEYLLLNRLFDDDDEIPVFEINQDYVGDDEYSDGADSESEDEISDSDDEFPDGSEYDPEYLASMIAAQSEFDEENSEYEDSGESPFMMARASAGDLTYNDNTFYLIKENVTPDTIEEIKLWGQNKDLCILNTDVERKFCITTTADINHSFFATDNDGVIEVKNISRSSNKDTGKNEIVARVTPLKPGTAKLCFDKSTVSGKYEIIEMKIKVKPELNTMYIIDSDGREIKNRTSDNSTETMYQMSVGDLVKVCYYKLNDDDSEDIWASGVKINDKYLTTKDNNNDIEYLEKAKEKEKTIYENTNEGLVRRTEKHYKVTGKNVFLLSFADCVKSMYINVNVTSDATSIKLNDIDPTTVYTQQNPYQMVVGESFTAYGTTVATSQAIFRCDFEGSSTQNVILNYTNTPDTSYANGRKIDGQFTAAQPGLTEVTFEGKSFWVNVRANQESDNTIYVITALGERDKDKITETIEGGYTRNFACPSGHNNGTGNPYYICKNETVELCFYSDGTTEDMFESADDENGINIIYNEMEIISASHVFVKGESSGNIFKFTAGNVQNSSGRDINHNGQTYKDYLKFDSNGELEFTAAGPGTLTFLAKAKNDADIKINDGKNTNLIGIKASGGEYTYSIPEAGTYKISKGSDESYIFSISFRTTDSNSSASKIRNHAVIKGLAYRGSDDYKVTHKLSGGGNADFYIHVIDGEWSDKDHADIEITDGGFYEFRNEREDTSTGTKEITIERYDTHIVGVNKCYLYKDDGSVHVTFEPKHYVSNGTVGSPQYELTSKYYDGADKAKFHRGDIKSAKFDVSITLIPSTKTVTVINTSDNSVRSTKVTDISGNSTIQIPSAIFNLGLRSVIDAYNKCPNHSGLDFNVSACLNTIVTNVEFRATKNFIGNDNQPMNFNRTYTFELVDKDGYVVSTAENDSTGKIVFGNVLLSEGTYQYTVREKIPVNAMEFDSKKYQQGSPSDPHGVFYDQSNVQYKVEVSNNSGIVKSNYYKVVGGTQESISNFTDAFNNEVIDEVYQDITVEKKWSDGNSNHNGEFIAYNIFRTDESGNRSKVVLSQNEISQSGAYVYKDGTFYIGANQGWKVTLQDFPTQLGGHRCTYELEEINTPDGYSASYDTRGAEWSISNILENEISITVKKEWYNVYDRKINAPFGTHIEYYLEREVRQVPVPVRIQFVNLNDAVKYETTVKAKIGGNFAFRVDASQGTILELDNTQVQCSCTQSGNFFNVSNIQAGAVVKIRYSQTFNEIDLTGHFTFDSGTAGWTARGGSNTETAYSTLYVNDGNNRKALKIENRKGAWEGGIGNINSYVTQGNTYSFSAYVQCKYPDDNTIPQNVTRPENVSVRFSLYNANNSFNGNGTAYIGETSGRIGNDNWIHINIENYTIPTGITGDIQLLIETYGDAVTYTKNNQSNTRCTDLYIDEVVIAPAGTKINVDRTGVVSGLNPARDNNTFSVPVTANNADTLDTSWKFDCYVFMENGAGKKLTLSHALDQNNNHKTNPDGSCSDDCWRQTFTRDELINALSGHGKSLLTPGYEYRYFAEESPRLAGYEEPSYENNRVGTNTPDNPIIIKNKQIPTYRLPPTGGIGADKVQKAGLIFICFASAGYLFMRRIKRRSG